MADVYSTAVDAGAVSCVLTDRDGRVLDGVARRGTERLPGLVAAARATGADDDTAGECLVVGADLAWYLSVADDRVVVLVTPVATSVALGWSLLRRVVSVVEGRA